MPKQTFFNLPEEKRTRIIDLALEEFASRPYSKASLSNVVARAGIAKGSMYQYFEDKGDLYTYLLELAAQEKLAYIQKHGFPPGADFFTALEQVLLAGISFSLEHPRLGQVVANALESPGEGPLHEFIARGKEMSIRFFKEMIIEAQEKGTVRRDMEPTLLAYMIHGILGYGLTDYILNFQGVTKQEFLADPRLAARITEEETRLMIRDVIKILRNGLG